MPTSIKPSEDAEVDQDAKPPVPALLATKGLFILPISDTEYVVQDALGCSSLPHLYKNRDDLERSLEANFGIRPLISVEEQFEFSSLTSFSWKELEYWYVANLDYALNEYVLLGGAQQFYAEIYGIPIAYLELGYGDGSRNVLEHIDKIVRKLIAEGKAPFKAATLEKWLVLEQFKRIFKELMSLIHRAIEAFLDLLSLQRTCVREAVPSLPHLESNEVIHHGRDSYRASTAATMAAISLCTSLDIQSKLIHYLDQFDRSDVRFKPAGGRHFSDLRSFRPRRLPASVHGELLAAADADSGLAELIQFRHDVVHSTSAIELEKVYVGFGTPEVNSMPLHYSFQGWRDCAISGQPDRYLGRDFFIGKRRDMEHRVFTWIQLVIRLHLGAGARIHAFLSCAEKDPPEGV